jgi:hypothetical protein
MPARFTIGTSVRVKAGTPDPNYSDIPIGGWCGAISEVEEGPGPATYLIEWDRRTLDAMHPVYRSRCERDGLQLECMWLEENHLEADTGEAAPIEQPTQIVTRPLRITDPQDRIRAILGVTSDDPLPDVDEENLHKYHRYLGEKLTFPFEAMYEEETEPFRLQKRRITVTALLDSDEADEDEGLLCEVQENGEKIVLPLAEVLIRSGPNRQLVADYRTWMWNWQGGGTIRFVEPRSSLFGQEGEPASPGSLLKTLVLVCLAGGIYGGTLGAAWASGESADVAIKVGASLLGLVGAVLGAKSGRLFGAVNHIRYGPWFCGAVGVILGAVIGGMLGAMLMAFVTAILGALVGGILGKLVGTAVKQPMFRFVVAGSLIGVIVQAWRNDADAAWSGAWAGAVIGVFLGLVLFFGVGIALAGLEKTR